MDRTVTTIKELMPHLEGVTTAKELGARVIALVPTSGKKSSPHYRLRQRLALAARDRLGVQWSDAYVKTWLSPANHGEQRAKQNRENVRRWQKDNREKACASAKRWQDTNGERRRAYARILRATDVEFRLGKALRSRIRGALRGSAKSVATLELIGCTVERLRSHIEGQFLPGMSWNNYGDWHVDHRIPCASFQLSNPDQQRLCFHYSNLQPLWASDNLSKGSLHEGVRYHQGKPR